MTDAQKNDVKEYARKFYLDGRVTLEMAVWAMKNAGYSKDETANALGIREKKTA